MRRLGRDHFARREEGDKKVASTARSTQSGRTAVQREGLRAMQGAPPLTSRTPS
ncbi:MAG: hypothetical protein ACE5LB_02040 [Acidiferrobacterales bacterium]